jgi:two-component system CAI-1 autoinducer sensor kinase/phosphatase CqsS
MLNLKNRLKKVTKYIEPNIVFVGAVGAFGFPLYYLIWQYLFPQPYENLFLRIVGTISFLPLLLFPLLPRKVKEQFYWYFFIFATYAMPFFFSFMLLKNEFSLVWTMSTIAALSFLIAIVYDWILVSLMVLIGFGLAYLCVLVSDGIVLFSQFQPEIMFIYLFAAVGGLVVSYRTEVTNTARLLIMKSMAGSISHELRNPLNAINLATNQLRPILAKVTDEEAKQRIDELDLVISNSISQANNIINIILADLSEKPIEISEFSFISVGKILPEIVAKFTYNSDAEKQRVRVELDQNFTLKVIPERLTFIIYNLLMNSLCYIKKYPNSIISVGTESKYFKGKKWDAIYVHDTGPGIAANKIPKLFDDFFTFGKKSGTGLGLAFCKRNMKAFGGDIICESEVAKEGKSGWTKFYLLFPQLSEVEIAEAENESKNKNNFIDEVGDDLKKTFQGKKAVLADDQKLNRMMTKNNLTSCGLNVIEANDGKELLELYKNSLDKNGISSFDLIITDINMPPYDGDEAAKKIREIESQNSRKDTNHIPIIALSGNGSPEDIEHFFASGMDDYFIKGSEPKKLIEVIESCLQATSS